MCEKKSGRVLKEAERKTRNCVVERRATRSFGLLCARVGSIDRARQVKASQVDRGGWLLAAVSWPLAVVC